ncbi:hypothetical protein [Novosphingobium sp. ERW19]|uniref:hypothetical protein n=1 Tax=Novosphingobium sp. ERW19 TaxID=2726186 RepID=UPI0014578478|nr:hypothetical protein [Novosphingobium sp. ERW19]NLR41508.1 hypothetical protein [Novosphingobium sp. ERW19]
MPHKVRHNARHVPDRMGGTEGASMLDGQADLGTGMCRHGCDKRSAGKRQDGSAVRRQGVRGWAGLRKPPGRTGTGGTANTCETQEFRGLLVPAASAVAGALAVLSARLLESHRCSLPTCECPGDDLLATPCRLAPARKSISCLSISARVRRFATPGKSR